MRVHNTILSILASLLATATIVCAADSPLSVCDVLNRRAEFNHKVIAIRGVQKSDEGVWLTSSNCVMLSTPEGQWPAVIYVETDSDVRKSAGFHAEPYQTEANRINAELQKKGYDRKRHEITLTYIGRFESAEDLRSKGSPPGTGFGHLSSAPARLIVSEVKDLSLRSTVPAKK